MEVASTLNESGAERWRVVPQGEQRMDVRNLVIVLGDQLDRQSSALDDFDSALDRIWMAEIPAELAPVPSHKARIGLLLTAMRHYREDVEARGFHVVYRELGEHGFESLHEALAHDLAALQPQCAVLTQPNDQRALAQVEAATTATGVALDVRPDRHFICSLEQFEQWADGRNRLRLEFFYREQRVRTGILMDGDQPLGGTWNFAAEQRAECESPSEEPAPPAGFAPDAMTWGALARVKRHFADQPGSLEHFDWPVTPAQAERALRDFIDHRLPDFARYQDTLRSGKPFLYHSRLSAALNLKLISPRRVIDAALAALDNGHAPLVSVEGFVRQVLGWREFVRGVYWRYMPDYQYANALGANRPLPDWYWTGDTDMACLRETIQQTLAYGYANPMQRLMITGMFALLLGVHPYRVHEWYLGAYVDAIESIELPNAMSMSQYADGGRLATRPFISSGRGVQRLSNYCTHCRYRPEEATGEEACPFTTLYWDFLARHRLRFADHAHAAPQWRALDELDADSLNQVRRQAAELKESLAPIRWRWSAN